MTPLQYKSQYINLRVDISQRMSTNTATSDSNTYFVGIKEYRSGISNLAEKNRVLSIIQRNSYRGVNGYDVARAFNSKASVAQYQRVVAALIDLHIPDRDLQVYCNTFFGLDCSGFVNRYFEAAHGLSERNIPSYYQRGRRRLRIEFEDFRDKDVLIWCNNHGDINAGLGRAQHIAVIDKVREQHVEDIQAIVVESTGTIGLVHSNYTFYKTNETGVFRVHRPLKASTNHHVKVVPVV